MCIYTAKLIQGSTKFDWIDWYTLSLWKIMRHTWYKRVYMYNDVNVDYNNKQTISIASVVKINWHPKNKTNCIPDRWGSHMTCHVTCCILVFFLLLHHRKFTQKAVAA